MHQPNAMDGQRDELRIETPNDCTDSLRVGASTPNLGLRKRQQTHRHQNQLRLNEISSAPNIPIRIHRECIQLPNDIKPKRDYVYIQGFKIKERTYTGDLEERGIPICTRCRFRKDIDRQRLPPDELQTHDI